jgi:DNA polymerase-3 subunit epsilon
VDTLRLARQLMTSPDEVADRKLGTLAGFFGTPTLPTHRALDDARATASVLRHLLERLEARGVTTIAELTPWLETLEAAQAAEARAAAALAQAQAAEARAEAGEPADRVRPGSAPSS